jgi:small subunit ribosomal protein S3
VPLHTLRANIDYALAEAHTTFGLIGVKVWIYKGDAPVTRAEREAAEAQRLMGPGRGRGGRGGARGRGRAGDQAPKGGKPEGQGAVAAPAAAEVPAAEPAKTEAATGAES